MYRTDPLTGKNEIYNRPSYKDEKGVHNRPSNREKQAYNRPSNRVEIGVHNRPSYRGGEKRHTYTTGLSTGRKDVYRTDPLTGRKEERDIHNRLTVVCTTDPLTVRKEAYTTGLSTGRKDVYRTVPLTGRREVYTT